MVTVLHTCVEGAEKSKEGADNGRRSVDSPQCGMHVAVLLYREKGRMPWMKEYHSTRGLHAYCPAWFLGSI